MPGFVSPSVINSAAEKAGHINASNINFATNNSQADFQALPGNITVDNHNDIPGDKTALCYLPNQTARWMGSERCFFVFRPKIV